MAMSFPINEESEPIGSLELQKESGKTKIFVIPSSEQNLQQDKIEDDEIDDANAYKRWHLLDVMDDGLINIYPFKNWEVLYFLPKYELLSMITLEGYHYGSALTSEDVLEIIDSLPKAFVKTYSFGLGFKKEYTPLVSMLEGLKIAHLTITKKGKTTIDPLNGRCSIKHSEFEELRKSIDRVTRHAQKVSNIIKGYSCYNTLSFFLKDEQFPQKPLLLEDTAVAQLMAKASPVIGAGMERAEKKEALDFVAENTLRVLKQEPERLIKLKNDIELATLDELVDHFEKMLEEGGSESSWQYLFNENPFILNMAFGYPVIKIQGQTSVGGRKFSGDGDKITDFLMKNNLSNNVAIIEIKKPGTKLLVKTAYRDGVFAPSSEFTGAINQMLDQKYQLQKSMLMFKDTSRIYDLETYSIHGVLIIGRTPTENNEQKSFELFRGNSKDITVITFDELLGKLKQLRSFLRQSSD